MRFAALVPLKDFALAKQRLRPVLTDAECSDLARAMLDDVLIALGATPQVSDVALVGGTDARRYATQEGTGWIEDAGSLNAAMSNAAAQTAQRGAERLLIVAADIPLATAADLSELLERHADGLTICRAARDGGTNALALTPPDALEFQFGPDSARRHRKAALAAGLESRSLALESLQRDIDTPDDLSWLCQQQQSSQTIEFLANAGIAQRLISASARAGVSG